MAAFHDEPEPTPTWLVAAAGWALPGLGYGLGGDKWRGIMGGSAVVALFVAGLFIGGVRVVDLPGFADGHVLRHATAGGR